MQNIMLEELAKTVQICGNGGIMKMLADIGAESTSSSSSDSKMESRDHPKCRDFVETIEAFDDEEFKSHFRLNRSTVDYLIGRYEASHQDSSRKKRGKPQIASNTLRYRQLAILFGVTKSTAWAIVRKVVGWLMSIGHEFIVWPTGEALQQTTRKFLEVTSIPGVISAIDCTHITINAPKKDKHIYFDRKKNYSIVLQAIVDADKKFIDIYCGEPGSYHDCRVLKRSPFYRDAETRYETMFPNNTFILGDSAYPLKNYLMPVYKDYGSLTRAEIKYNNMHSSARIVVENAFGLLKGRFRRLGKFTEHRDISMVSKLVASACILHNICILSHDNTLVHEINDNTEPAEPAAPSEPHEPMNNVSANDAENLRTQLRHLLNERHF